MSFLLKIVQGPNAGAEIALAEGVNLSFGRADDCDIVLSDSSVADKAFELEVTGERVVAVMPGGKDIKLEPYHVVMIGTTAIAVGPQEGSWKALVWPRPEKAEDAAAADDGSAPAENAAEPPAKRRPFGCLVVLLLLFVLAGAVGWAYWKYPEKSEEYFGKGVRLAKKSWAFAVEKARSLKAPEPVAAPKESLAAVAADCGFTVSGTEENPVATGDFKTRVARLEATARAYAARPGLKVDFTDAESLALAVRELFSLVSDGRIALDRIEGRKAVLSGYAGSRGTLENLLRSLSEDVPKITGADCSRVVIGESAPAAEKSVDVADETPGGGHSVAYKVPKMKKFRRSVSAALPVSRPEMPVVGVLTVPYPCLVLSDGTRAMEGARFGGFTIEKIAADRVTVRGADGSFDWRP